jgi:hypothetical protein
MAQVVPFVKPSTQEIELTLFVDERAQAKKRWHMTPMQMVANIHNEKKASKADLPWLKLAVFGDQKSERGSYRHNANVKWITGACGDYDGGNITFDEAEERLHEVGVMAVIYTTPSYTDEKPRWRVVAPASKRCSPEDHTLFMNRLNGIFDGGLAGESWSLSQGYYFGSVEGKPPAEARAVMTGKPIDLCTDLPEIPKKASHEPREHRDAEPYEGKPISIEQARAMADAAGGACADLHYPDLFPVIMAVARTPIAGEEGEEIREELARLIWDSNTTSESKTDDAFKRAFNAPNGPVTPGTFFHYAKLGGWSVAPRPHRDPREMWKHLLGTLAEAGSVALRKMFTWRTPAEDATQPPLTYWDDHRGSLCIFPRVPGGCGIIVYGPMSSHKTGLVLKECADAVFNKSACVLYLAPEGANGIRTARLPALCAQRGKSLDDLTGRWYTMDVTPGLLSEADIAQAIEECREHGFHPDIIVIDTMTRAVPGADISSPAVGTGIINGIEQLARAFGATVIAVTHPGKDASKGSIGSVLVETLAFAIWRVSYNKETSGVRCYVKKMKDGPQDFAVFGRVEGGVPVVINMPAGEWATAQETDPKTLEAHRFKGDVIACLLGMTGAEITTPILAGQMVHVQICKGSLADGMREKATAAMVRRIQRHIRQGKDKCGILSDLVVCFADGTPVDDPYTFKPPSEVKALATAQGFVGGVDDDPVY